MNEKQAKRIRRAMRAYVLEERPNMTRGPRAAEAARQLTSILHACWPRLTSHRARGRIGAMLRAGRLSDAASAIAGVP